MKFPSLPDLVVNEKYTIPAFVNEGDKVLVPYKHNGRWVGAWSEVIVAAGTSAKVKRQIDQREVWYGLDEIRITT